MTTDTSKFHTAKGDLFDYAETHVIGHGVNVKGVMGGGIAAQFAQHYPEMRDFYRTVCGAGALVPGGILPWSTEVYSPHVPEPQIHYIANCASQCYAGADARLNWLYQSLILAASYANSVQRPLAICEIGCDIGGLYRDDAYQVFVAASVYTDHGLTVVKYAPKLKMVIEIDREITREEAVAFKVEFEKRRPMTEVQTYTGIYAPGTK